MICVYLRECLFFSCLNSLYRNTNNWHSCEAACKARHQTLRSVLEWCTVSREMYMESEPQACVLSLRFFFCPVRNLVCQPSQTTSGFSNRLLNILMSLAAYCCLLAKPYCPNYSQYNNKQVRIGGVLSLRSVRLSQITFMSSFKARFLTAVEWPLYLFCSPVSLVLTQLEAGRLTKLKACPSRKNLPISGQELLH